MMLPGQDGWSVAAGKPGAGRETPVLFLTARDAVPDRARGFELGALYLSPVVGWGVWAR